MGRAQHEDDDDDALLARDDLDPASGPRKKQRSSEVVLLMAEFRRRAAGLDGAALEGEIDRLMDLLIERHAKVAPENLKPEVRAFLKEQLVEDPTLQAMLGDLRAAVKRG